MTVDVQTPEPTAVLSEDATSRLMRMLESVRLEKAEPLLDKTWTVTKSDCPQCHSETLWGDSLWCPDCAYYPKLGRSVSPEEIQATLDEKASPAHGWAIWLAIEILAVVMFSSLYCLLEPEAAARGPAGRIQFVVGILLIIVAQIQAFVISTRGSDSIPLSSIFFEPLQLWPAVFKQLPRSRQTLYLGINGLLAVVLAVAVVGMDFEGMFHGMRPRKRKRTMMQSIVQLVSSAEGNSAFSMSGEEEEEEEEENSPLGLNGNATHGQSAGGSDMESSLQDFAGAAGPGRVAMAGETSGGPPAQIAADFTPPADSTLTASASQHTATPENVPRSPSGRERVERSEFLVIGYLANSAGEIRSVLARTANNRLQYAGKLSLDEVSDSRRDSVQKVLDQIRTRRPILQMAYQARWVRPIVLAHVAYVGWTPEGLLREAYLIDLENRPTAVAGP